ncbi:MAG: helicase-related protein, partial [Anaerobiospirillum sp.]|nr:helicase-related protein [Anaerobiospirillum sp.]
LVADLASAQNPNAVDIDNETLFTRIHSNAYVKGMLRLYMTATPKIYGEAAKAQELKQEAILYSMDDEDVFGPNFHVLDFDRAVALGCLVDYQVIVFVLRQSDIATATSTKLPAFSQLNEAKAVAAWKAINKFGLVDQLSDDSQPMRRLLGFTQVIDAKSNLSKVGSKQFAAHFQEAIDHYRDHVTQSITVAPSDQVSTEFLYLQEHNLTCDCKHIDGSMNALQKTELLNWLRSEPESDQCHILFNVRCLGEGVNIVNLDGEVFFSPRKSQVEVVQIVGRVMRTAPNKKRGYVIIPVIVDDPNDTDAIFSSNREFDSVWQVLKALKSLNPDRVLYDAANMKLDPHIQVVCSWRDPITAKTHNTTKVKGQSKAPQVSANLGQQGSLLTNSNAIAVEEQIEARIVSKLGNRREWQDWAEDVAKICSAQVEAIEQVLANGKPELKAQFDQFCQDLQNTIHHHLERAEIIEMLAQHIVIKPVLDEIFRGFPFTENNAIARPMSDMLQKL